MQALARSLISPCLSDRFMQCACPCALDTYQNCDSYKCLYCDSHYKANWTHGSQRYPEPIMHSVRESDVRLLLMCTLEGVWEGVPDPLKMWSQYIYRGAPIQIGHKADPFPKREKEYRVTLAVLRMLHECNIPVTVATKAAWWARESEYAELFARHPDDSQSKNAPWHAKISISSLDPKSGLIEPGVPSPYERLEAVQILSSLGVATTIWIRPFIPGLSDDWKQLIEEAVQAGVKAVSVEWLTIPTGRDKERAERFGKLSEILGYDIQTAWKEGGEGSTLKPGLKSTTMKEIRAYAHARGLKFTVSDVHNKDLSDCGNCCGAPASMDFLRSNAMWAVKTAMEKGEVRWDDLADDLEELFNIYTVKEAGIDVGWSKAKKAAYSRLTIMEYVRVLWNDPENPDSFWIPYGKILEPAGRDENGNGIYKYVGDEVAQ